MTVCGPCARRRWLLARLSGTLDLCARDPQRLWHALALPGPQLIDVLGGTRRAQLHSELAHSTQPDALTRDPHHGDDVPEHARGVCRHRDGFPLALCDQALAPCALDSRGHATDLLALLHERQVVAIVGTRRASDHGMQTAAQLARDLAATGVVVVSGLDEGIALAALHGALNAHGATLAVLAGGLGRCYPVSCRSLYRALLARGCAISEAPAAERPRYWGTIARARTIALLASATIVVEAEDRPSDLACARAARILGHAVAAVPGRVSSPFSRGSNQLLKEGAAVVRHADDMLELLHGLAPPHSPTPARSAVPKLEHRLYSVIERVGAGEDTLAVLAAHDGRLRATAAALTELELRGLLARGDGGRYVIGPAFRLHYP